MQNNSGQDVLLGEVFSCSLKAGGAVFRMGYPPTPVSAGALLCRMGGQVLYGQISCGPR